MFCWWEKNSGSCRKTMEYIEFFNIFVLFTLFGKSSSHLNLYIFKEDLKKDLNLVFGRDVYLINNGEPASLLQQPNSFHELIAPLPSSINKICFRWSSFPNDDYQNIKYTIKFSSSDGEIMPVPTMTINQTGFIPIYEQDNSKFNILFPCTGRKEGIVNLGFHLNYTAIGSRDERHLRFTVRRHCSKRNDNHEASTGAAEAQDADHPTYNLVIGLSVAVTLLMCIMLFCFGNWQLQKRKRELQVKFDYDYEMMVKCRDGGGNEIVTVTNPKDDSENTDLVEKEESLVHKLEALPPPIFTPKSNQKLKNNKYSKNLKIWMDTLKLPYCSSGTLKMANHFGLEKIPEEETLLNNASDKNNDMILNNKNESAILTNSYAVMNQSPSEVRGKRNIMIVNETAISIEECNHPLKDEVETDKENNCKHTSTTTTQESQSLLNKTPKPIFKKKHLKRAFDKPGEDKAIIDLGEEKLAPIYQYLNQKWMKHFHDCLLTPQQLILGKQPLGKGTSCNVHQGKLKEVDNDDNIKFTPVVVKTLVHTSEENNTMSKFINEALLLKKLNHKNIMGLVGVLLQPKEPPVIVMPFMKYADLNQFLRNARGTPRRHQTISTRQLVNFSVQIACGMEYLASMKYVHRDLATRNCMLGEELKVKISNLGLARDISKENYRMNKKTRLPIKWMAPESLNNFIFSEKSDVWSFGVVLWEIISLGKQPYTGLDNSHVQDFLMKGQRLEKPQNCPEEFFHLMSLCWIQSPHDRPSFKQLHKEISTYEAKYQKYCIDYTTGSMVT